MHTAAGRTLFLPLFFAQKKATKNPWKSSGNLPKRRGITGLFGLILNKE